MNKSQSGLILKKLSDYYGEVEPDLEFQNNYQLTAAVLLSAQTTDKQVNAVTPLLFQRYPGFRQLASAHLTDVERIIKSTGFYKNKAKNLVAMAKMIMQDYNSKLPDEMDLLTKLPGIGRKSASVILSIGFNKPALAVDTHIIRISNRLGYIQSDDPYKVEMALASYIAPAKWKQTHLLLIRHGRSICSARKPLCNECPIYKQCENPVY